MNDDDQIISELGIENLDPEQQQEVLNEFRMLVGEALAKDLSNEQMTEYFAIIDGNEAVIASWLTENVPDYKEMIAYQELAKGFDQDPDQVSPDKVFASFAWVQKNNPNLAQTVEEIKTALKAHLANQITA